MSASLPQGRITVWQVETKQFTTGSKIEGGSITVTLFATQEQAIKYANQKANEWKNRDGGNEEEEEEEGEDDEDGDAEHDEATGHHLFPDDSYPEWPEFETNVSQANLDFSAPSGQLFEHSTDF